MLTAALALVACASSTTGVPASTAPAPAPAPAPASACASSAVSSSSAVASPAPSIPGCVGGFEVPPPGAREVEDAPLVARAVGKPGEGKLCAGKAYEVVAPIVVHRVWQAAKPHTLFGGWWSFDAPHGPLADFRARYVVCPAWTTLDVASTCTLKVGARFVVGPGQSATCGDGGTLPASAAGQIFVPNDARAGVVLVDACEPLPSWP